ncbi:MAG: type II toxin-antitoxin system RelE family toxin [Methanobacteriaceae archaeon]
MKKITLKDKNIGNGLYESIGEILENPFNSKILKGKLEGTRRVRKGKFRIVFYINNNSNPPEIRIYEIGMRKNIYK